MNKLKVQEYYDYTLPLYRLFWHGNTRAIHYGIWNSDTKNLKDSLLNTNKVMADLAEIHSGEKVLDAGCGVGGSSFWLVKNRNVNAVGITISERQLKKAKQLAKRLGLENKTEFYLQDYKKTTFSDSSFDVVWAIESVCYASDKNDFIKEAYRVLKPNGKLVLGDGCFLEKANLSQIEKQELENFIKGWVLSDMITPEKFEEELTLAGFKNIKNIDKTSEIIPTAMHMARMSRWSFPLSKLTAWLHLTPSLLAANNRAGIDQLNLFKNRILTWRIFVAEK